MTEAQTAAPLNYEFLRLEQFPTDYEKAVEHLFQTDIDEECKEPLAYICTDSLTQQSPPFVRWYKRRDKTTVPYNKRRPQFQDYHVEQLDPLHRFTFRQQYSESEHWFRRWFLSDFESDAGQIFESRGACYALQFEPCYNCACRKSLRWYGGSQASWQDLVCVKCNSTYEIKTKATLEKIETCFAANFVRGGSFSRYCQLRHRVAPSCPLPKMFLVLLARLSSFNRAREPCFPVYISEIDSV